MDVTDMTKYNYCFAKKKTLTQICLCIDQIFNFVNLYNTILHSDWKYISSSFHRKNGQKTPPKFAIMISLIDIQGSSSATTGQSRKGSLCWTTRKIIEKLFRKNMACWRVFTYLHITNDKVDLLFFRNLRYYYIVLSINCAINVSNIPPNTHWEAEHYICIFAFRNHSLTCRDLRTTNARQTNRARIPRIRIPRSGLFLIVYGTPSSVSGQRRISHNKCATHTHTQKTPEHTRTHMHAPNNKPALAIIHSQYDAIAGGVCDRQTSARWFLCGVAHAQ